MLYTVLLDDKKFLGPTIDSDQIESIVGPITAENIENRIDYWHGPKSFAGLFNEPLKINFTIFKKAKAKYPLPDIAAFEGRLFLNSKAYDALHDLIKNDGEFLPATYDGGKAFVFIPLNVAEDVGALDAKLSRMNEWGDLDNLAFYEKKLGDWVLFRAKFNAFYTLQCTQAFVDTVQQNQLKGLYITKDLGSIFTVERSEVSKLN